MILAGDVGGTKVNLALFDFVGGKLKQYTRSTISVQRNTPVWKRSLRSFWLPTK